MRSGRRNLKHPSEASNSVEIRLLREQETTQDAEKNIENGRMQILAGPAALISIILLTGAAVSVLLTSRNSPISSWAINNVQIQPTVWLSVLSTLMDGLTMFALARAAEITYWRTAARGTTWRGMYDLYESQFIVGALKNLLRWRGDRLAVVSVVCMVSALRGPLFQRASVVDGGAVRSTDGVLRFKVAQLVPPNFLFQGGSGEEGLFDGVYNAYLERAPIYVDARNEDGECGDRCEGKVKGYGFDIKCSDIDFVAWDTSFNSTIRQTYQSSDNNRRSLVPAFNSSAILVGGVYDLLLYNSSDDTGYQAEVAADKAGWIEVTGLFKTEPVCGGNVSVQKCSVHHAVVEYDVAWSNGTLSLRKEHWQDDNVLFLTPSWNLPISFSPAFEDSAYPWGPTTHWVGWLMSNFNEEISLYSGGGGGTYTGGASIRQLLAKRFVNGSINTLNCSTTFSNPTHFVLDKLREIAFRTAVAAAGVNDSSLLFGNEGLYQELQARAENWTQSVNVTGKKQFVAYTVNVTYLICAVICSLSAVVAIVPLYWGGGRFFHSFNPLDVVRVLDVPVVQDADGTDAKVFVRGEGQEDLKSVGYEETRVESTQPS